jgi:hypothetical protein
VYHPETDGQTEHTNQTLEDMLHMYVMDQQKRWEEFLPLVEFAYNESYQSAIKMAPFEFLYGRPCRAPLSWDRLEDRVQVGPEAIPELEDQMQTLRQRIKEAQDCQKSYDDVRRVDHSYDVAIEYFCGRNRIRVRSSLEKGAKLSPRFVGSYEIVEKRGPWPND